MAIETGPRVRVARRGIARAARATGSLLVYAAAAMILLAVLNPLIPVAHPEYTATAVDTVRGYAFATFMSVAVVLWGAPSFLRQVLR